MGDVTQILSKIEDGDPSAAEQLLPLIYEELRRLGALRMAEESPSNTLQPTALVHEAYIRLVDNEKVQHWNSRGHFFHAAAEAMRRILVDHARKRNAVKRGGDWERVPLDEIDVAATAVSDKLLALDEALDQLSEQDPVKAQLVKLRYFAGLTIEEAAQDPVRRRRQPGSTVPRAPRVP